MGMDDWEQNAEEDEAAVDVAPVSEEPPPVVSQAKPQVEEPSPGPAPVAVEEKVDAVVAEVEEAEEVAEVVVGDEKVSKLKEPDPRPHMNCVFIGHVDAGKSTTCGNVLFLTGCVDERAIEKYQKEGKNCGGRASTFRNSGQTLHNPRCTGAQILCAEHDCGCLPSGHWRAHHLCPQGRIRNWLRARRSDA